MKKNNGLIFAPLFTVRQKIVVFDNMSDDSTPDIVQRCNITELHHFDSHQKLRDDLNSRIKSGAWLKYDNYDWVICVDSDEFLYHPHIFDFLEWCEREKISVVTPRGYDMSPASTFPYSPSNEKIKFRHSKESVTAYTRNLSFFHLEESVR